jgi:hypothetical protein
MLGARAGARTGARHAGAALRSFMTSIVRRGKVIAQLEPVGFGQGAGVKALLRRRRADKSWLADLMATRDLVAIAERT